MAKAHNINGQKGKTETPSPKKISHKSSFLQSKWFGDFVKPINILSIFIAAISLFYAIYVNETIHVPKQLSFKYYIYTISIKDLKLGNVGLYDSAGNPILQDVYVVRIAFWNSGDSSIYQSDMFQPLRFVLNDANGRIISITKIAESQPQLTEIKAIQDSNNSVIFNWKDLDINTGATYQIALISNKRYDMVRFPAIFYNLLNNKRSTAVTGYILEGKIVDLDNAGRNIFYLSVFFTFLYGLIGLVLFSFTKRILALFKISNSGEIAHLVSLYLPIPYFIGMIVFILSGIYVFFIAVPPHGLNFFP